MKSTFKNLTLTAVLLSLSVSVYASTGVKNISSENDPAARCSAIAALGAAGDEASAKELAALINDLDPAVRSCAVRAAGESKNEFAEEALLANIEGYQAAGVSKGPYENNLKARLKAIDSIWALGEIGNPRLMSKLSKFYKEADDVIKMNLMISIGKLKANSKAGPFLFNVAADAGETEVVRSVAFEMLEHIGYPSTVVNLAPSKNTGIEKADMIFTGGITGTISGWVSPDLPIGHAGLFVGTETKNGKINVLIADCVPDNFKPAGGVRNIDSWNNFTHHFMYPYYGNRTTPVKPTAAQRQRIVKLALAMGKKGLTYSDTHGSQKGPLKFDCVGYTEFLYEAVGLNPTENSYETGWGWPLTPWEQFIATKPNAPAKSEIIQPNNGNIIVPDQAIITGNFASLTGALGMNGVQAPEVATDITPVLVD